MDLITSVYDQPQYFEEWLDSVKHLGFNRVIVGVDGREETVKELYPLCQGVAELYSSVEHVGIPRMLNSLFALSENNYACKLDADDIARPNMLIELEKVLGSNPNTSVVLSRCRGFGQKMLIGEEGKEDYPSAGAYNIADLKMIGGFNMLMPTFSDTEFFIRMKALRKTVLKTEKVIVDRRLHGDNFSEHSPTRDIESDYLACVSTKFLPSNCLIPFITVNLKRII